MKKEVIKSFIIEVIQDFENILIEELSENEEQFPYTNACIEFMVQLENKGIHINLDAFDQQIIDQVYRELIAILSN
ncbi:MAG: hypothetical protein HFI09_03035 [Bacilli bacterium]|nr:hypothetical protein [Bacilli bacterium]